MTINIAKYDQVMNELQAVWDNNTNLLTENADKFDGIRSSQITALVALLVEKGVFDDR